jgi:hypothetical protein
VKKEDGTEKMKNEIREYGRGKKRTIEVKEKWKMEKKGWKRTTRR